MFFILVIVCLRGEVMVLLMIFGLVLGKLVWIMMVGGIIFGYLLMGSWNREMVLLIRISSDSIVVKIGCWMKNWEKFIGFFYCCV